MLIRNVRSQPQSGFTIIELLIVVVVIAILAAVVIVAYGNITARANVSLLKSDLSNAVKRLKLDQVESGSLLYPATLSQANNNAGLSASEGVTYEYTVDNGATPPTFCLTATRSGVSYYTNQDGTLFEGACPGHGGGAPPLTFEEITFQELTSSGSRSWRDVASSADGTKLAAVVNSGYVYTSTDSGATWTERTAAGSRTWTSIVSSADGTKLAGISSSTNNTVMTSWDSGVTWTARNPATGWPSQQWGGLAMTPDGSKLYAVPYKQSGISDGCVYKSTDSGATWATANSSNCSFAWSGIATTADGLKLIGARATNIQRSTNGGTTWSSISASPYIPWFRVAMSDDGMNIYVTTQLDDAYRSVDGGTTWSVMSGLGTGIWRSIDTSTDGTKVVVAVGGSGNLSVPRTSVDSGATWVTHSELTSGSWFGAATTSDGSVVYTARSGGYVYRGTYN